MKTQEQLQTAVDAVRKTCAEHGIVLIGTCSSEGIYGEILVAEAREESIGWIAPREKLTNQVRVDRELGDVYVDGIGDLP